MVLHRQNFRVFIIEHRYISYLLGVKNPVYMPENTDLELTQLKETGFLRLLYRLSMLLSYI